MQYSIPLPADYGTEQVHRRVRERRALFDAHPGLVHKSFIYSEKDHLYAPFYVWESSTQARHFLLDDLFKGVTQAFSCRRVRNWMVLSLTYGNRAVRPSFARREIDSIPAEESLSGFLDSERAKQREAAQNPMLYLHVTALDADRWEVMHYSLWSRESEAGDSASDCCQTYSVLHVSEPAAGIPA